jgi:hypothetical protein
MSYCSKCCKELYHLSIEPSSEGRDFMFSFTKQQMSSNDKYQDLQVTQHSSPTSVGLDSRKKA